MSITLPPLPETNFFTADLRSEGVIRSNVYTAIAMQAYATAAVEADRASRVPMSQQQMTSLINDWMNGNDDVRRLIRAVEARLIRGTP